MKHWLAAAMSVMLVGAPAGLDLQACGEKVLMAGRGARFLRTPGDRGASAVLVLATPTSMLAQSMGKLRVDASLRKAGYKPTVIGSLGALRAGVTPSHWDVLMIDLADVSDVRSQLAALGTPLVVPVVQKPTSVQLALARAEFPVVLRSPDRSQDFLDALDAAIGRQHTK
jgi:hypothetical protein